jgi:DNA-binding MarR family transcriptional regulator
MTLHDRSSPDPSDEGVLLSTIDIDEQLCFALYAATNAVVRAYRPLLAELGLTYAQYIVMLVLWRDERATVGNLARRLCLAPNAVTPVVERLEAVGLVRRERDEDDRRIVHVSLTEKGHALEDPAARAQLSVVCATKLTPTSLAALRDDLHALTDNLSGQD